MEYPDQAPDQVRWDDQGVPHSTAFNDRYFCRYNGYEEAVHVACQGNSLQERFLKLDPQTRGTFTIIETGFGTGLHFCCAWQIWEECAPPSWTLHFISLELFPVAVEQLNRALSLWPLLARYKTELTAQYQPMAGGGADWHFDDRRVHLTVVFDHVVSGLRWIKSRGIAPDGADAWFLDGFSPFKNPEMWSEQVFAGMAALSRADTTLSTFTVAGSVRRGLEAQGFEVHKLPGYGKKQHILTGRFSGRPQTYTPGVPAPLRV